jgi:HTH-type transcriptional regulator/antitoxin HigA
MKDTVVIPTNFDYEAALVEYEAFFDKEPQPGTPEAERFQYLGKVLSEYEKNLR